MSFEQEEKNNEDCNSKKKEAFKKLPYEKPTISAIQLFANYVMGGCKTCVGDGCVAPCTDINS